MLFQYFSLQKLCRYQNMVIHTYSWSVLNRIVSQLNIEILMHLAETSTIEFHQIIFSPNYPLSLSLTFLDCRWKQICQINLVKVMTVSSEIDDIVYLYALGIPRFWHFLKIVCNFGLASAHAHTPSGKW